MFGSLQIMSMNSHMHIM